MQELTPIFSNQKNFYKKAFIEINGKNKKLYSYNILVAEIRNKKAIVYNLQSNSTLRHVKDFLKQFDFLATTKKQIIKDYFIS